MAAQRFGKGLPLEKLQLKKDGRLHDTTHGMFDDKHQSGVVVLPFQQSWESGERNLPPYCNLKFYDNTLRYVWYPLAGICDLTDMRKSHS